MTPLRARAPRGQRVVEPVPFGHWQTSTLIQAIDHQQVVASLVVEGASNLLIFETFIEQILVPQLQPGDIVILDTWPLTRASARKNSFELWVLS